MHIIRDGRDIALSLKKMGGFAPLPWDRGQTDSLVATALYWEWMIHRGRAAGRRFGADYIEIRYEDLITKPQETLGKLGGFIDHDLDYDQIQRAGLGRLSETNSSFREEGAKEKLNPLGAGKNGWRMKMWRQLRRRLADASKKMATNFLCPLPSVVEACGNRGCEVCIQCFSVASYG